MTPSNATRITASATKITSTAVEWVINPCIYRTAQLSCGGRLPEDLIVVLQKLLQPLARQRMIEHHIQHLERAAADVRRPQRRNYHLSRPPQRYLRDPR